MLGIVSVATLVWVNVRFPSLLEIVELTIFDLRMYAVSSDKRQPPVAIAAVDDKSLAELGQWPWPRAVLGQLVTALKDYKVATIGFDIVTSEPDTADAQRAALAARLKQQGMSEPQI